MQYIEFFYHNAIVTVQTQEALSYIKDNQPQGILVDMWKLIILLMNNKDVLFIDSQFKFLSLIDEAQHELILNFYQIYDYSVSQSFIENQFDYNTTIYDLSPMLVSENYLFVFLDNFWPVAFKIIIQIFIYITYMIVPWIIINLNFIAFFLLDSPNKLYYQKLKESIVWFGGQKKEQSNICKQIYRLVFAIMSVFITVILFSDFTYLIINSLAKSNFNTIQDMKDNNAVACYYYEDKFLEHLFERDRGLQKIVGQSSLQCMEMLDDHTVDVVIMGEFNLLIFLEENKQYLSKLRYQIKLNTNIAHHILINKSEPEWFQNELKTAIDMIQKQKLDLQIKEKHLPTKLYNSKSKSIMPYQPTLQFICACISIFFILIVQATEIVNEFKILRFHNHRKWIRESETLSLGLWQKTSVTVRIIVEYIYSDIKKKPRSFKIGLFTIYLVVMFLALIQSAFSLSPLIFIQLAETSAGDTDIVFTPIPQENRTESNQKLGPKTTDSEFEASQKLVNGFNLVNQTEIEMRIQGIGDIFDSSPRWLLIGDLYNQNENVTKISDKIRSFFLLIDSQKEISIGMGRRLETEILKENEVLITQSGMRGLNATHGDILFLNIDVVNFLSTYVVADSNSDKDPKNFVMAAFDTYLNQPLEALYGTNFTVREYTGYDIKILARDLILLSDLLDRNPDQKQQFQDAIMNQVDQQNVSQDQKDQMALIIDILFSQELGYYTRLLSTFVNMLSDDEIVSIVIIEQILADIIVDALDFDIQLKVKESIDTPKGKWADGLGNIVVMDYKNASQMITEAFIVALNDSVVNFQQNSGANSIEEILAYNFPVEDVSNFIRNYTQNIKLQEYTLSSNIVVNDRVFKYSSDDNIEHFVIDVTNDFYNKVGFDYPVKASVPLATAIKQYLLLGNFIDNLVVSATFLLLMLSILLIYSLMIGDVEEKTYEYGMLRALGFQKWWLIILLMLQSFTFAIPGLALGMITCYVLNSLIAMFIFDSSVLISSYDIADSAIGLSFGIGLFIPLASNILPILRALSKTLRDSLDLYHRTVNDIFVNVIKLEKMGISIDQFFTAALLVIMGFVSYYLVPMTFIFSNIKLALAVINIILIVMIIGFTLLANLFEEPLEKLILNLILCIMRSDRNLKKIIYKNMEAHYSRNWKTTLMYTIALAFLIFAGAGFALQTSVITDVLQSFLGADISVQVLGTDKRGLDEYKIRQFMNETIQKDPSLIYDYSFTTLLLSSIPEMPSSHYISTLAKFPYKQITLGGVEKNYLRSCLTQFYIPNDYDSGIKYDTLSDGVKDGVSGIYDRSDDKDMEPFYDPIKIVGSQSIREQWYDDMGEERPNQINTVDREINIVVPEGYIYEAGINVETPSILYVDRRLYRTNVRHLATKVPGYLFSSYRSMKGNGLISMEDALYIVNDYFQGNIQAGNIQNERARLYFSSLPQNLTYGLPKDNLQIKFARSTTEEERVDFSNALRNFFLNEQTLLFDVISLKKEAEDTFYFITIFYIIVALVSITLSFFLILVSFVSNVKDNSWEFGVFRAVGLNKQQITRVYIYEAVSLITASGLIGTIIGLVVAITLTLQILMFTEFSFKFVFPTEIFLITFLGGFFTAIGASYLAVLEIRDKSISTILKGLY